MLLSIKLFYFDDHRYIISYLSAVCRSLLRFFAAQCYLLLILRPSFRSQTPFRCCRYLLSSSLLFCIVAPVPLIFSVIDLLPTLEYVNMFVL